MPSGRLQPASAVCKQPVCNLLTRLTEWFSHQRRGNRNEIHHSSACCSRAIGRLRNRRARQFVWTRAQASTFQRL